MVVHVQQLLVFRKIKYSGVVAAKIKERKKRKIPKKVWIALATAYFPGETSSMPSMVVNNLVEYCRRNKLALILGREWGSSN